ncbi:helix-turn-helix transcriptional regulator [Clostridium botulinum]|uniref:helix-turn-helix transcriptional regulator n=1 Tax=Clostridium botulinum TaxID=1491 RepID=UPI000772F996|nr:helix-turn-helix transcriptional regulator [Clostridium botulinum]
MLKIRLKKLRLEKNLTQKELAKISRVGKSTISDIENNLKSPRLVTIYKLAKALNISWKRLIYDDDNDTN